MTYAKAEGKKFLHVYTNIGNKQYHFQCKFVDKVAGGFKLSDIKSYDEDVFILNSPLIITYSLPKRTIRSFSV